MAFCSAAFCLRAADSSIEFHSKHSTLKNFFRRKVLKTSSIKQKHQTSVNPPIIKSKLNRKVHRIRESNLHREEKACLKQTESIEMINYDMTVLHDEQLDDTQLALSRRQSKQIPRWARKSQLQFAIINQIYYNDKQPEEIFGDVRIDLAHDMVSKIDLWNTEIPIAFSYDNCPANFV